MIILPIEKIVVVLAQQFYTFLPIFNNCVYKCLQDVNVNVLY